jgi:hypothetical protein
MAKRQEAKPDTPGEETADERAARIARENVAAKQKQKVDVKEQTFAKARKLADAYKPLILPFKDRDGKIVPCIVVGDRADNKRKIDGDFFVDPKTRELVPEHQLIVWVFGGADQPHQAVYKFDDEQPA